MAQLVQGIILSLLLLGFCPVVKAFDSVTGGGDGLVLSTTVDNANKALLEDLVLSLSASASNEPVVISFDDGAGFEQDGTGTISLGVSTGTTNLSTLNDFASSDALTITNQATLEETKVFVESGTENMSVGTAGTTTTLNTLSFFDSGDIITATDSLSATTQIFVDEATETIDLGTADATTVLDTLADFANGDTLTVTDSLGAETNFSVTGANTVADLVTFLDGIINMSAAFDAFNDRIIIDTTQTFTITSNGALATVIMTVVNTVGDLTTALNNVTNLAAAFDSLDDEIDLTASENFTIESTGTLPTVDINIIDTVTDLTNTLNGITNLTATFDDPNDRIDLTSTVDFQIASTGSLGTINMDAVSSGNLEFSSDSPNLVITSGTLSIANLEITSSQISFTLNGSGDMRVQDLGIFGTNFTEKGEFFETRTLKVAFQGADFFGENFVVDTTNYVQKLNFVGSSGGEDNDGDGNGDTFIIGDTMSFDFAPFDFSSRGSFTLDLTSLGGTAGVDVTSSFTVVSDDDDSPNTNVPISLSYAGTGVTNTFNSKDFDIDNQPPSFDLANHLFLSIPEGKVAAGIADELTVTMPTESSGDTLFFTANFSDVGGSIVNFVDAPFADQSITLQEVAIDTNYDQSITFRDDAGNTFGPVNTNQVSVDLIRPVISTTNILSVVSGNNPAIVGDTVQVALPVDTAGSVGDTISFSLDMTQVGDDTTANLEKVTTAQNIIVVSGALNNTAFAPDLTLFDKAENTQVVTLDPLQIDNMPPVFDTSCGATFQVIDEGEGDDNGIADFNNGVRDRVFFLYPNKNIAGCDIDRFDLNLYSLTKDPLFRFYEQEATGTGRIFYVAEGSLDNPSQTFVMTVYDAAGNTTDFSTGPLNVDNSLSTQANLVDRSVALTNINSNGVVLFEGRIDVRATISTGDVVQVLAHMDGAASQVELSRTSDGQWIGPLDIFAGDLVKTKRFITFTIIDDAGNVALVEGEKPFLITNNTRVRGGGGGGSLSLSKLQKKSSFRSFTPNQTDEFHDSVWDGKFKSKALLRLESLKRRIALPSFNRSRISPKSKDEVEKVRALWRSRQKAMAEDGTPQKMQKGIEEFLKRREPESIVDKAVVNDGEFRIRTTLNNLKELTHPKTVLPGPNYRKVRTGQRGKFLYVERKKGKIIESQ